jgi:hypothetical protein
MWQNYCLQYNNVFSCKCIIFALPAQPHRQIQTLNTKSGNKFSVGQYKERMISSEFIKIRTKIVKHK